MPRARLLPSCVLVALLSACGREPAASSPPVDAPKLVSGAIRASLSRTEVGGGAGEVPDTKAIVRFENVGGGPCTLRKYTLRWGSGGATSLGAMGTGKVSCDASAKVVAGGASLEDTCVVHAGSQMGAAPSMQPANTQVIDLDSDCAIAP